MTLNIGFIRSESQFMLKQVDYNGAEAKTLTLDTIEIKETPLNLLIHAGEAPPEGLQTILAEEEKFYPIAPAASLGLDAESFASLSGEELKSLLGRVGSRWVLANNIQTIEQVYGLIVYLRDLWSSDRHAFFEELWFALKTNLAATELTLIFHDVKEPDPDKAEKPSLVYSHVTGAKTPQLFDGGEKEEKVMERYQSEFEDRFQVTEYDSAGGKLVGTVKIGLSPILLMAKLPSFNQLQRSILISIFSGLRED